MTDQAITVIIADHSGSTRDVYEWVLRCPWCPAGAGPIGDVARDMTRWVEDAFVAETLESVVAPLQLVAGRHCAALHDGAPVLVEASWPRGLPPSPRALATAIIDEAIYRSDGGPLRGNETRVAVDALSAAGLLADPLG